jgi:hypothetical protein
VGFVAQVSSFQLGLQFTLTSMGNDGAARRNKEGNALAKP